MFDYRRSTDLFPLKLLTEIWVRTAWQTNLEDSAAEKKKTLSFSLTGVLFPIPLTPPHRKLSFLIVGLWWWVSHVFETGEKSKIHCFGKEGPLLPLPSPTQI